MRGVYRFAPVLFRQHQDQAILADGEADAGSLGPAQHLAQAVVAPAAEQRVLRAQAAAVRHGELKRRPRVVVEPAYQARVHCKGNATANQRSLYLREVVSTAFVEIIADHWKRVYERLVVWVL